MAFFQFIIISLLKKEKCNTYTQKICLIDVEGSVTDRTHLKWIWKFHTKDFSQNNALRLNKDIRIIITDTGDSQYTPNLQIKR